MLSKISIVRLVPSIWVSDHGPGAWTMSKVINHIPYIRHIIGLLRHALVMQFVVFIALLKLRTNEGEDLVQSLELIRDQRYAISYTDRGLPAMKFALRAPHPVILAS